MKLPEVHWFYFLLAFLPNTALFQDICVINICSNSTSEDGDINCSCFTSLDEFREYPLTTSDVAIIFSNGTYLLDFCWKIVDISSLEVRKEYENSEVNIMCQEGGTLYIRNSTNVAITGLTFTNCSGQFSISVDGYNFSKPIMPAISIWFGCNLSLTNITIEDSITGLCIIDVSGTIRIDNVEITRHRVDYNTYNNFFAGNLFLHRDSTQVETKVRVSQLNISNFGDIDDKSPGKSVCIRSSGLTIFAGSPKVSYSVNDSVFSNNQGKLGGSLSILLVKLHKKVPVIALSKVILEGSNAVYGGGLYISLEETFWRTHNDNDIVKTRAIQMDSCIFRNNRAVSGGGLYIQWNKNIKCSSYHVLINSSNFTNNSVTGSGGLGLHCKVYINSAQHSELHVNISVKKCKFSSHYSTDIIKPETGVLFANSAELTLSSVNISDNKASGVFLVETRATFEGASFITLNRALSGGGISLCSKSLLYFRDNTKLLISNNRAETVGGGIVVNNKCPAEMSECFYQFYNKTINSINITVSSNKATIAGNNIFGGSIDTCYFFFVRNEENKNLRDTLHVPYNDATDLTSIASNPQHVCLANDNNFSCLKERSVSAFPGENVTIKVRVVGQLNGSVPGIVHVESSENLQLLTSEDIPFDSASFGELNIAVASKLNHSSTKHDISLHVGVGNSFVIFTEYSSIPPPRVYFYLKPCPMGFALQQNEDGKYLCSCKCCFENKIIKSCKLDNQSSVIVKKANTWIGHEQVNGEMSFISGDCPLDYCNKNKEVELEQQDLQCNHNRSGIMCGLCPSGWSMMLGTSRCSDTCSNLTLLFILPILLVGLLLIITISGLDLTITRGTINGVIFYANILQTFQSNVVDKHHVKVLSPTFQTFLSWFNMDMGVPTCFFKGMTTFSSVLLEGAFPLYLWLVAFTVVVLSNKNVRLTRFLGENPVQVVATLILLTYSKMLRVALSALRYTNIYVFDEEGHHHTTCMWYLDSTVKYLRSAEHITLFIIAILFITVTFPFTVSLLCIRNTFKLSNYCRCFSFIDKLKPFFDAYTGPFNDRARFWPGLLLLVRIIILFITITPNSHSYYVMNLIIFFLLSLMVCLKGVYKKRALDALEVFFLLNLAVIFATEGTKVDYRQQLYQQCKKVIINSSLFIYVVVVIAIVGYHVKLKLSQLKCLRARITQSLRMRSAFDVSNVIHQREEQLESCEAESPSSDHDRLINFSN